MADSDKTFKIAAVGSKDTVLIFKSMDVDVFFQTAPRDVLKTLKDLVTQKYSIVFITESVAVGVNDFLNLRRAHPYPIFMPIPDGISSTGYGQQRIKDNMERAIGSSRIGG
ncbi:MAG: hypothetical protein FWE16_05165 [Firmicutes bacterium]|nr:hypothetical protein [Bacillota bacterium]